MNAISIRLYNLFRYDLDLPDARAEEFVDALSELTRVETNNSAMEYKSVLKEDMLRLETGLRGEMKDLELALRGDMSAMEIALRGDMSAMELALRGDMSAMEMTLRNEIKETKVDTIKWMVGIFLALALMILGLYIKK